MIYCDAAACTQPATHHLTGPKLAVHACEEHFTAMRPLVPHVGEPMSVTRRALVDTIEATVRLRSHLDTWESETPHVENVALAILEALTERPNTRELLIRYLEEIQT